MWWFNTDIDMFTTQLQLFFKVKECEALALAAAAARTMRDLVMENMLDYWLEVSTGGPWQVKDVDILRNICSFYVSSVGDKQCACSCICCIVSGFDLKEDD